MFAKAQGGGSRFVINLDKSLCAQQDWKAFLEFALKDRAESDVRKGKDAAHGLHTGSSIRVSHLSTGASNREKIIGCLLAGQFVPLQHH